MDYKIVISNEKIWLKDVSKLSKKEYEIAKVKIQTLKKNPWPDGIDVKQLKEYHLADFRLRVGHYRVLFDRDLEQKEVILYRILHRSKLY